MPRGILQGILPALERKDSDGDLSESDLHRGTDQPYLEDSNRSLGDVEFALESPVTTRSPTKTSRGGIMRKRSNFDASNASGVGLHPLDFDHSTSRTQTTSDSLFVDPPPLVEIDESMEKSHHKPQRSQSNAGSKSKSHGKSQEIFILRLSVIFLLTGCLFLSSKHYRLVHRVKTSSNIPRDPKANVGVNNAGANFLQPNAQARIIGGASVVDPREYPWFVLFHGSSICGGVLIASDVVLTAAHVSTKVDSSVVQRDALQRLILSLTFALLYISIFSALELAILATEKTLSI
jgi:Trypsin